MKREFVNMLWNCLFPRRCIICDEILGPEYMEQRELHATCCNKVEVVSGAICFHCGRPLKKDTEEYCYDCKRKDLNHSFVEGRSLYLYKGEMKKVMYRFKYSNKREYASFFAREAYDRYHEWLEQKEIDCIVPVPMYKPKMKQRGYNQAQCFAKELSRISNIPMEESCILRMKDTKPQKELNDLERQQNLKSAFKIVKNIVQYNRILVVDDIYTTGSTADAVACELKTNNTQKIYVLSICIGEGI